METLFIVLLVISSISIIVSTLLMEPKTEGMGSLTGGETNIFGKSASRGKERILSTIMVVAAIVFLISSILISVVS
ncbi:MAG: preprotein translocase subunit SecG [Tissierellia bacterium]|nr:preprotein translocase subunit SecG [Tissierellia bacterium]